MSPQSPERRELIRDLTVVDRSPAAWDGELCVGTAGSFRFGVTVPGGGLAVMAGVSLVTVAATHRRRGVLTSMMSRQPDDFRAWGEPLTILGASEPAIYGRFGYGPSTHLVRADIDTSRVRLAVPEGNDGGHVRLVEVGAALEARTYRVPVDAVFDVTGSFCPWNEGGRRLSGDPKGAICERTGDPADLALDVRDLGTVYLGGTRPTELAAAGRVRELRPGALAEATVAFTSDTAPGVPHDI